VGAGVGAVVAIVGAGAGAGEVVDVGAGVGASVVVVGATVGLLCTDVDALEEDMDAGGAVVDSPPEQPAAFQVESALQ